jgi:hypothetical protein
MSDVVLGMWEKYNAVSIGQMSGMSANICCGMQVEWKKVGRR